MAPKITNEIALDALLTELGRRLKELRISKRLTQAQAADLGGMSRATLLRLEGGQGGDLRSFLAALKALDRASALEVLLPESAPSPIEMLKRAGNRPQRVRAPGKAKQAAPRPWKWGDER